MHIRYIYINYSIKNIKKDVKSTQKRWTLFSLVQCGGRHSGLTLMKFEKCGALFIVWELRSCSRGLGHFQRFHLNQTEHEYINMYLEHIDSTSVYSHGKWWTAEPNYLCFFLFFFFYFHAVAQLMSNISDANDDLYLSVVDVAVHPVPCCMGKRALHIASDGTHRNQRVLIKHH